MIQSPPAVVGNHDAVASGALGGDGIFDRHDALEYEFHTKLMRTIHDGSQFGARFRRHGASHAGQGNQPGCVDVHTEHTGSGGCGPAHLALQFLAFPRLDERNPPAAFGGDGGIPRFVQFIRRAVPDAADNARFAAAGYDGPRIFRLGKGPAHIEGGPPYGSGQHGQAQPESEHLRFRDGLLDLMNQTHVQTDAGKRGHIVLERAPGSDAAHTGRFACAGAPIAHGTNTAKTLHALFGVGADFLNIHNRGLPNEMVERGGYPNGLRLAIL